MIDLKIKKNENNKIILIFEYNEEITKGDTLNLLIYASVMKFFGKDKFNFYRDEYMRDIYVIGNIQFRLGDNIAFDNLYLQEL